MILSSNYKSLIYNQHVDFKHSFASATKPTTNIAVGPDGEFTVGRVTIAAPSSIKDSSKSFIQINHLPIRKMVSKEKLLQGMLSMVTTGCNYARYRSTPPTIKMSNIVIASSITIWTVLRKPVFGLANMLNIIHTVINAIAKIINIGAVYIRSIVSYNWIMLFLHKINYMLVTRRSFIV